MGSVKNIMDRSNVEFSILITAFNDEKNYVNFFENIEKQSLHPCELVIADGGSLDDSKALIDSVMENYSFKIRYIPTKKRLNIAQGYNSAVRECKTDKMLIMGIGNRYSSGFCKSMVDYFQKHNVDIVYTPIVGLNQNEFSKIFNIAFVGGEKGKDFGYASNRAVFLTKAVFERVGYFYENFVYAGEDSEYFVRAERAGLQSGYNTEGIVYWETPTSFKQYLQKNRVNAIADMQLSDNVKIYKHIGIRALIIAGTILSGVLSLWFPLFLWLLIAVLIICRIQSFNVLSILLRIHFIFVPSYYYIKERKYLSAEYKFKL